MPFVAGAIQAPFLVLAAPLALVFPPMEFFVLLLGIPVLLFGPLSVLYALGVSFIQVSRGANVCLVVNIFTNGVFLLFFCWFALVRVPTM